MDLLIEAGEALRQERAKTRTFHLALAIAFLATAVAGFAPTYYLRGFSARPALGPLLHVHGAVFTAWLVLFVVQTALARAHRVGWHKRLGIFGATLATAMVPLGVVVAIETARNAASPAALSFLIFPLGQIALFGAFVGAAVWNRKRPELHRRLMVLATAALMPPAISRIVGSPMLALFASLLFVAAAIIHDRRTRGRVHPAYVWGGVAMLVSGPLRAAFSHTAAWEAVARAIAG